MKTTILVDAGRVEGEIDPMIYGHFIENVAHGVYGGLMKNERPGHVSGPWVLSGNVVEIAKALRPPVVRWPGGLYADGYNWRSGVGPPGGRPVRANRYWCRFGPLTRVLDPNQFGCNEFMRLVRQLGAEPYVNVNLGTGSADEAAGWVEYMNGSAGTTQGSRRAQHGFEEPWETRIWGLGNEMYGSWALGHSGPREYARKYIEFRAAMEEACPGLRYVAVGADRYFSKTWNREVMSRAGDLIDMLSVHIYLPGPERIGCMAKGRARHGGSGVYRAVVAAPLELERRLREVGKDIASGLGGGDKPGVALDEWNLCWSPLQLVRSRWTLRDALFICGVFHALHRTSGFVRMANVTQLVNVLGLINASGDRVLRTAIYYPYLMYGRLAGPIRVSATASCEPFSAPRLGGIPEANNVPLLDCSATLSRDGRSLTVFVINRHMTDDVVAEIDINGFSPMGLVQVYCLNGPAAHAENRYGADEVVSVRESSRDAGDILPVFAFSAHSATALVLQG